MKKLLLIIPLLALLSSCNSKEIETAPTPVIHISDLTRPHGDPDDHWDLAFEFALAKKGYIDLKGVVCDNLPRWGAPDVEAVAQLNWITSNSVPVGAGQGEGDVEPRSGLELIRKILEESEEPVAIHIVGGCLDIVKAYEMWPELFAAKVKSVYLSAGTATNTQTLEYNVTLHRDEYAKMFDLPCTIYWMPCFDNHEDWLADRNIIQKHGSFYKFLQGRLFEDMSPMLRSFFISMLTENTSTDWLAQILNPPSDDDMEEFGNEWRNMWSTAGFLHAAGLTVLKDGTIAKLGEKPEEEVVSFIPITVTCNADARTSWEPCAEPTNRYIFEINDLESYQEAMTRALETVLEGI